MKEVIAVIPSRIGSMRFPEKPLALIAGVPLLTRVVRQVKMAKCFNQIVVATDDERIAHLAEAEGVMAVFTESKLETGTDRVFQAVQRGFPRISPDAVVFNVQGDEPLIDPGALDLLAERMIQNPDIEMGTIARRFQPSAEGVSEIENPMTAKVLLNQNKEAIYFSRHPIPFSRISIADVVGENRLSQIQSRIHEEWQSTVMKHIGVYSFRLGFLNRFCTSPVSAIELTEGLEQLRTLRMGARIGVVEVESDSWGVDTPEDVKKIEQRLASLSS